MATIREKWLINTNWTAAFGTEINSLASGSSIISSVAIANGTALDLFMDISISLNSLTTGPGAPIVAFAMYPLNQDGTTYGDGRFGSAAAAIPNGEYWVGSIPFVASTVINPLTGSVKGVVLPPGDFKLVLYNALGATLNASTNTIKYRTYNRTLSS